MNCKHLSVEGNTTKYYYCKIKEKTVDKYNCKDCMLKIRNLPERI